jgi:hypothetical protein
MNYKTIQVHVDAGPDAPASIGLAIDPARREPLPGSSTTTVPRAMTLQPPLAH